MINSKFSLPRLSLMVVKVLTTKLPNLIPHQIFQLYRFTILLSEYLHEGQLDSNVHHVESPPAWIFRFSQKFLYYRFNAANIQHFEPHPPSTLINQRVGPQQFQRSSIPFFNNDRRPACKIEIFVMINCEQFILPKIFILT